MNVCWHGIHPFTMDEDLSCLEVMNLTMKLGKIQDHMHALTLAAFQTKLTIDHAWACKGDRNNMSDGVIKPLSFLRTTSVHTG